MIRNLGWMSLYANRKPFTRENVLKLSNKGGLYQYYDKNHKPIYIGRASGNGGKYGLKHRVSSYYQVDDFKEHPTKKALRLGDPKGIPGPDYFLYDSHRSDRKRRVQEKKWKKGLKHNHW